MSDNLQSIRNLDKNPLIKPALTKGISETTGIKASSLFVEKVTQRVNDTTNELMFSLNKNLLSDENINTLKDEFGQENVRAENSHVNIIASVAKLNEIGVIFLPKIPLEKSLIPEQNPQLSKESGDTKNLSKVIAKTLKAGFTYPELIEKAKQSSNKSIGEIKAITNNELNTLKDPFSKTPSGLK